jgi:hypothetical protein
LKLPEWVASFVFSNVKHLSQAKRGRNENENKNPAYPLAIMGISLISIPALRNFVNPMSSGDVVMDESHRL